MLIIPREKVWRIVETSDHYIDKCFSFQLDGYLCTYVHTYMFCLLYLRTIGQHSGVWLSLALTLLA
jgi:hypothetical protein